MRDKQTIRLINFSIERQVQNSDELRPFVAIEFRNTSFVQIQDTLFFYCFVISCYGDWDADLGDSFPFVTISGRCF